MNKIGKVIFSKQFRWEVWLRGTRNGKRFLSGPQNVEHGEIGGQIHNKTVTVGAL